MMVVGGLVSELIMFMVVVFVVGSVVGVLVYVIIDIVNGMNDRGVMFVDQFRIDFVIINDFINILVVGIGLYIYMFYIKNIGKIFILFIFDVIQVFINGEIVFFVNLVFIDVNGNLIIFLFFYEVGVIVVIREIVLILGNYYKFIVVFENGKKCSFVFKVLFL